MPTYGLNEDLTSAAFAAPPGRGSSSRSAAPNIMTDLRANSAYGGGTTTRGGSNLNVANGAPSLGYNLPTGSPANYNFNPQSTPPTTNPGFDLEMNPGLSEQAFNYSQEGYLNNPWTDEQQASYNAAGQPSAGQSWMDQNLGTLSGPGQGDQYWNQVSGQFTTPGAGESYVRNATAAFSPQGASSAFNNNLQGQYNDFVNYSGAGNSQGQYGQSSAALAGGTAGESGMAGIAGNYSQFNSPGNAQSQYQQNAASGPLAAQSFFDQVGGSYGDIGQYQGQNLSAAQYAQTQGAFSDLPIADFDPYYDRAVQMAQQSFNQDAAGRGVYGSSESLSGIGNLTADLNAQRGVHQFNAEMQRAQEQRARQQLLGEQARMGDLSELGAFDANLSGLETFGTLANNAGNQTLGQQTMLGNQADMADDNATAAFNANTDAASAYGDIYNNMGRLELDRHDLLGTLANNADDNATDAQNSRISGVNALSSSANNADSNETARYNATTGAMLDADRVANTRLETGANIADQVDDNNRADFDSQSANANNAATQDYNRDRLRADIASDGARQFLDQLNSFNNAAGGAEGDRRARISEALTQAAAYSDDVQGAMDAITQAQASGDQAAFENAVQTQLAPALQAMGMDAQSIEYVMGMVNEGIKGASYNAGKKG